MVKSLRFAHLADLHLGGWREKKLTRLNFEAFKKSVDIILTENIDFVLFAGDIFNNAMPSIDLVEIIIEQINRLKEKNMPIYVIGGSHDYSNSGKSFISLLDKAGVFVDVCKFKKIDNDKIELIYTKNDDLKLNVVGVLGRKNGLDKNIYTNISKQDLKNDYFNLFMFHTSLDNFKPNFMKPVDIDVKKEFLPIGFDYYAGGHIHTFMKGEYSNSIISYSGCLFPNNFTEMKREVPGFNICEFDFDSRKVEIKRAELDFYEKEYILVEINSQNPIEAKNLILSKLDKLNIEGKIILLEVMGIVDGSISEIEFNKIIAYIYSRGALQVLKNTYKLTSVVFDDKKNSIDSDVDTIEKLIIEEVLVDSKTRIKDKEVIKELLKLDLSKNEEEKVAQYEQRVIEAFDRTLFVDEKD